MALRFMESFEFCGVYFLNPRWDFASNTNTAPSGARTGTRCYASAPSGAVYAYKNFDNQQIWIVGAACYIVQGLGGDNTNEFTFSLRDGSSQQIGLYFWIDNSIRLYRGTTLIDTSATPWVPDAYHYMEMKVTIDNTVGAYEVRMDGINIMSDSGVNTQETANAYANRIYIGGGFSGKMDDLYMLDGTGGAFDDFLGNIHVGYSLTNGAGNYSVWTANTGNTYEAIDDTGGSPTDNDTTYITTDTPGARSSFTIQDVPANLESLLAVQLTVVPRKDDVGARYVIPFIRIDGTDYDSSALTCAEGYEITTLQYEKQPDTTDWNETDFNAMEIGVKEGDTSSSSSSSEGFTSSSSSSSTGG